MAPSRRSTKVARASLNLTQRERVRVDALGGHHAVGHERQCRGRGVGVGADAEDVELGQRHRAPGDGDVVGGEAGHDDAAGLAGGLDGPVDGLLLAGALDGAVDADAAGELHDLRDRVVDLLVVDGDGAHALGEGEPRAAADHDHHPRARGACVLERELADGARPGHQDGVAGGDAAALDAVEGDAGGVEHGALVVA